MKVDFGETEDAFEIRRHPRLQPREAATTSSKAETKSSAAPLSSIASTPTTVIYPPAPTSTPKALNATANIDKQFLDTSILPADSSLGLVSVTGPRM